MWNDYYEAYFNGCYHYNKHQLTKLEGAIWLLYQDEYADLGVGASRREFDYDVEVWDESLTSLGLLCYDTFKGGYFCGNV